jgi:hypothetical protein
MPDGIYRRSRVVQEQLTAKGEHRSAGPVGLLVAATAEEAGLTLLRYDRDFDTIAGTTGQPVRTPGTAGTHRPSPAMASPRTPHHDTQRTVASTLMSSCPPSVHWILHLGSAA